MYIISNDLQMRSQEIVKTFENQLSYLVAGLHRDSATFLWGLAFHRFEENLIAVFVRVDDVRLLGPGWGEESSGGSIWRRARKRRCQYNY